MLTDQADLSRVRRLISRVLPEGSALRVNVVANFVGRAWTVVLGFLFVPVYLKLLGIEAYGLIGVFATLQAVFGLFDLGMGVTVNRELARLSAISEMQRDRQSVLRTLEVCYWTVSILTGILVFASSSVVATRWIQSGSLGRDTVREALRLMGLVLALQLPFSFYQGALLGLQRQVLLNIITVACGTARMAGTALVLWLVSPTIQAFFACQLIVSVMQTCAISIATWITIGGWRRAPVEFARLAAMWRFALAISGNAVVGIALTQIDKVILSRMLPLEQFGYYALAGTVASIMWQPIIPLNQALYPQFAQLFEKGAEGALAALYHRACQLMSVLLGPLALIVMLFSYQLILLWTGNAEVAAGAYVMAALLVAGTTLNGLASVPGYLQSAAGWPQLVMYTNLISAIALVPTLVIATRHYGGVGAAVVWVLLNTGYVLFNVPLMHRRLLRNERFAVYMKDVAFPVLAAAAVAGILALGFPAAASPVTRVGYLVMIWVAASMAAASAAPRVRALLTNPERGVRA